MTDTNFFDAAFENTSSAFKFKECWNVDLCSNNIFTDAIGEYLDEWERNTPYEIKLQHKLNSVRNEIIYNNTWEHNPSLSDLEDGDEVYIQTSYGWSRGRWPEVLSHDTHVNLCGGDTLESKFKYASLRIKKDRTNRKYVGEDVCNVPRTIKN